MGVNPFLYAVATRLPRLLAIPTNLIELSNCSISLHILSKFSSVRNGILILPHSPLFYDVIKRREYLIFSPHSLISEKYFYFFKTNTFFLINKNAYAIRKQYD